MKKAGIFLLVAVSFAAGFATARFISPPSPDMMTVRSASLTGRPAYAVMVTATPTARRSSAYASRMTATPKPTSAPARYILNKNTKKFHKPSCSSVKQMKDYNKLEKYTSRDEIIDMGYEPCQRCHP